MSSVPTPAAGGVVWRSAADGALQVAVVHRPHYGDWSLPKGKVHRGEHLLTTAVREVGEETGARVAVGRRLKDVEYRTSTGRKSVAYWSMRFMGEHTTDDTEVDDVAWLTTDQTRE